MRTMIIVMCETLAISILYLGVTSFRKKTRIVDIVDNGGLEDLINQLPDDILISIISRTPTITAVRTSVLSKRWRNLYKSVSKLRLYCHDLLLHKPHTWMNLYKSVSEFKRYCHDLLLHKPHNPCPHAHESRLVIYRLERLLRLCSGSKIHSFKLQCCSTESDWDRFEQCMSYLGKSGVVELVLNLSCCLRSTRRRVSFPHHLLSEIPPLKYLTLANCSLQSSVKSKCLSFQTLYLFNVTLLPGSLECILSNCLSLHSLTIFSCSFPPKLFVHGPLKRLSIECCSGLAEIELCASNLTTFECTNYRMVNLIFDHLPQLETLYICFIEDGVNMMPYVFGEFPKDAPHIKSLNFTNEGGFGQESVLMGMETFGNLRRLEICVGCMARTDLMELTPYLESCSLLEELLLNLENMQYDVVVERKPAIVLHTKLKKVQLSGFMGADNEIEFASYILKTAVALDQMFIIRCLRVYTTSDTKEAGGGRWYTKKPWSEDTRKNIEQSLQHQALSNTAKLIIRHRS